MLKKVAAWKAQNRYWLRVLCFRLGAYAAAAKTPRQRAEEREQQIRLSCLKKKNEALRKLLRRTPWWVRGHLHLGSAAMELELMDGERESEAAVSTIRVSALAVLTLLKRGITAGKDKGGRITSRLECEALYLLGIAHFFDARFDEALAAFDRLLEAQQWMGLRRHLLFSAHEYAGTAAMALERNEEAFHHFIAIPRWKREAAIAYLKSKQRAAYH